MPFRDPVTVVKSTDQDSPNTLTFNFGSVVNANATAVVSDVNVTLAPSGVDPVGGYQSLFGHIRWDHPGGLFNYARVIVQYWDKGGTLQIGQDTFVVNPSFVGGLTDRTFFRLPLRGERVKLIITNMTGVAGTISYSLFASHRVVDKPYYEEKFGPDATPGYGSDGLLAFFNQTIVPTTVYPIALHQGRVMVTFRSGAASTAGTFLQVSCAAQDAPDIGGWLYFSTAVAIGTNMPIVELILPARPCKFTVNGAAGGIAFNIAILAQDR